MTNRYTLTDETKSPGSTLRRVLDNGEPTEAWATERANLGDEAEVHGGYFHGGDFRGGYFRGGVFRGGYFHGGVFRGGYFRGGYFHGGVFHGGYFHDGVFRRGWLPLQIQGSMHFVGIPDGETIQIGCKNHSPDWWRENYARVGRAQDYTPMQIDEYARYIELAAAMIEEAKGNG